jgi:DUF1680 family protein
MATVDDKGVQIHQYAPATLDVTLPDGRPVTLDVDTDYPTGGRVAVRVKDTPDTPWALTLRVPHWATGATLEVDGKRGDVAPGSARVHRRFVVGEAIVLNLPVRPRLTAPDPRIDAVRGSVAAERGPVVLCLESVDLPPDVSLDALRLDPGTDLVDRADAVMVTCRVDARDDDDWPYRPGPAGPGEDADQRVLEVPLRPYHDWASRGPSTMRVWLPVDDARTSTAPLPTRQGGGT